MGILYIFFMFIFVLFVIKLVIENGWWNEWGLYWLLLYVCDRGLCWGWCCIDGGIFWLWDGGVVVLCVVMGIFGFLFGCFWVLGRFFGLWGGGDKFWLLWGECGFLIIDLFLFFDNDCWIIFFFRYLKCFCCWR